MPLYCPKLIPIWLVITSLICTWDSAFVLLRPRSLPGGDLHKYFFPYAKYIKIDRMYGDMQNPFAESQGYLNVAEIVLNLVSLALLYLFNDKSKQILGTLLALIVNSFTFWKTVLYVVFGEHFADHSDQFGYVFLYLVPGGVWIVLPFICILQLTSFLKNKLVLAEEKLEKNKQK